MSAVAAGLFASIAWCGMALAAQPAAAVPTAPASTDTGGTATYSLSREEADRVLAEAAKKREAAETLGSRHGLQLHGEAGFMIGTGGMMATYGTVAVPLGDNGYAAVSFEIGRAGNYGRTGGYRGRRRD